jgi:site-specific DNA-methyltransferase (adenine-specific)
MLLIRRERLRRQKRAYGGTTPSLDKSVDARLHRGRCEAVICDRQAFPERSVDVVLTDPPYSDEYYESWKRWTRVEHDAEKDVKKQAALLGTIARLLVQRRIIREQFFWFSFCPLDVVHEFLPPLLRAFEGEDFVHQVLAWDKGGSTKVEATRTFARQVEAVMYINVGTRPLAMLKREGAEPRLMHSSLLRFPAGHKDENNVFWKPVPLLKHLIALATGESQASEARSQVVLDPFAGSGSTGVAAIECGRDFRLIESHPKQYDDCRASVLLALKEARRGEE